MRRDLHHHNHRRQFFEQFDNPAEAMARYRVHQLRRFYQAAVGYGLLVPFLFAINYLTNPGYWWAWWSTLGLGIAVAMKGLRVLGWQFWSDDWEDKKVADILAKKGR